MNLNTPTIDPRPLTVADLDEARKHSTGSIYKPVPAGCGQNRWPERRVNWPAFPETVPTDFGAPEGGTFRDPVPSAAYSMRRHDRIRYRIVLALLLGVAGYVSHIAWPMLAA